MNSPKKVLILIRHAHRDTTLSQEDNSLSPQGKNQALGLCRQLSSTFQLENFRLLSSPKVRCVETLKPFLKKSNRTIETDPRLFEQQPNEDSLQFKKRITEVLKSCYSHPSESTLICSHGDWLSFALKLLVGARADFKKASWVEVSVVNKKPILKLRYNSQ